MAGIRALLGLFPKTGDYEGKRNELEKEYFELVAFRSSKELRDFNELEAQVNSEDFLKKKKEIHSLRYKQTDDFQKEKLYKAQTRAKDIRLFYKTKDSADLKSFLDYEKSEELKKYNELEAYVKSAEFGESKREASLSSKEKFAKSDLAKTYNQYIEQQRSVKIDNYYKFVKHKSYKYFQEVITEGIDKKVEALKEEVDSAEFKQKLDSMKKAERKISPEKQKVDELTKLIKGKAYKNYSKLLSSPYFKYYDELKNSAEIEAFEELDKFIKSDDFKRQRKEIESRSFKDTEAYSKLQEYNALKKSDPIKFYFKFNTSKQLKNYTELVDSSRIKEYEELETFINSDEFKKFKDYCLKSPKKRWIDSREYEILQDYELKKKSEKITWYFKNINHKRFAWHRIWEATFSDEFSSPKIDAKKWLTRYYWGEKMFKGSYSRSQDKHFVTDGENLNLDNGRLHIVTKKENFNGKSWDAKHGFITREFKYTSGLVNTANSFQQKYGTFEAKIKITEDAEIQNSFALMAETMLPHIEILFAGKKLWNGNHWGESKNPQSSQTFKRSRSRKKFASDFFIFTLEWLPGKITWKINGIEIASTNRGIPDETMYIVFSAGLQKEVDGILPAFMEIDWVRCYQQQNDLLNKE